MQRPILNRDFETARRTPQARATRLVAVGALHVGAILALASGLNMHVLPLVQHSLVARVLPVETIAPPPQLPAPSQPVLHTELFTPIAPEKFVIQPDAPLSASPLPTPTEGPVQQTVIAPTAALSLAGTHTTPPYPPLSRRLGEEGRVVLHILIGEDGTVRTVDVAGSSGIARLDDAARQWVLAHWKYRAATRDGKAVPAETQAVVLFSLKNSAR